MPELVAASNATDPKTEQHAAGRSFRAFVCGAAKALDMWGTLKTTTPSLMFEQSDFYALASDWNAVGNDLTVAFRTALSDLEPASRTGLTSLLMARTASRPWITTSKQHRVYDLIGNWTLHRQEARSWEAVKERLATRRATANDRRTTELIAKYLLERGSRSKGKSEG